MEQFIFSIFVYNFLIASKNTKFYLKSEGPKYFFSLIQTLIRIW